MQTSKNAPPWFTFSLLLRRACPRTLVVIATLLAAAPLTACGTATNAEPNGNAGTGTQPTTGGNTVINDPNVTPSTGGTGQATPGADGVVREAGPVVAAGGAGLATLTMSGCIQADYYADVIIGKNHFSLLMDSGSTTTAAAATACSSCGRANGYDGSTGTNTGKAISTSYGDGSAWTGTIYRDAMAMGTVTAPATPAVNVAFAAITQQQNNFFTVGSCSTTSQVAFDGIMGLGPDTLLETGSSSFLTALAATKKMANDAFAVQTCEVGGKLMFGGYDAASVTEQPFFTPLVTAGTLSAYYSINMIQLSVGGVDTGLSASRLGSMVVDNGTSYLLFPTAVYTAFLNKLNADTTFRQFFTSTLYSQGSCEQAPTGMTRAQLDAALPKLQMRFPQRGGGSATLAITATHSYLAPLTDAATGDVYYCPTLAEGGDGDPMIMGNAAMRDHVVIFDRAGARVGFAAQTGCNSPLPSASSE